MMVKELKKGDFFKRNATTNIVYVRGLYIRELKKYECYKFDDCMAFIYLRGDKEIHTDFEF